MGTHDQYFTIPAINATYDRVRSAGTAERFSKRIVLAPNGKHGVVDGPDGLKTIPTVQAALGATCWPVQVSEPGTIEKSGLALVAVPVMSPTVLTVIVVGPPLTSATARAVLVVPMAWL